MHQKSRFIQTSFSKVCHALYTADIYNLLINNFIFLDFVITISTLIEADVDESWVERGFVHGKKLMLLVWNLFGQVILLAYKSVLLGSLIAITYDKPLHTVSDVASSELPIFLPVEWYQYLFDSDPREEMREIGSRSIIFHYSGSIPKIVWDR